MKSKKVYCFGAGIQGKRWIYILEDWGFVDQIQGLNDNTSCNSQNFQVLRKYGFQVNDQLQKIKEMNIYPMILAGAAIYTKKSRATDKTYWIHYGNMSWMKHNIVDLKL